MGQMQNPPAPSLEAFNALNSHIGTLETPQSITLTPGTNITFDNYFCYKLGRLCVVNIRFNTSAEITGNATIATGFPKTLSAIKIAVQKSSGGGNIATAIYNDTLTNDWGTLAANSSYFATFSYVTNS